MVLQLLIDNKGLSSFGGMKTDREDHRALRNHSCPSVMLSTTNPLLTAAGEHPDIRGEETVTSV